jgi:hypothetical protein
MADFSVTRYETYKAANTDKDLWVTKEEFQKHEKSNKACSVIDFDSELKQQNEFLKDKKGIAGIRFDYSKKLSIFWAMKDLKRETYPNLEKEYNQAVSAALIEDNQGRVRTAGFSCGAPSRGPGELSTLATLLASNNRSTSTNTTTIVNNPTSTTPATTTPITTPSTPAATYITPTLNFPAINQSATVSLSVPVNNGVSTIPSNFTLALDLKKERWDGSWTQIGIQNAEITDTDLSGINAATGFDLDSKGYRIKYKGTLKDTSGNTANGSAVTFYNGYTYFPVSLDYRSGFEHVQNGTMTAADFGAGKNKITTSFIITGAGLSANIVPSSSGTDQQWSITQDAQSNYRATITPLGGTKLLLGDDIAIANKIDPTTLQSTPLDVYAGQTYTCIGNNFVSGSPNLYHVTLIKITSVTATQIGYELLFKTTPINPTVSSTIETGSGLPTPPLP